ncbi:Na+/H+ antiporter subunit E [Lederbergia galactosidilytica]|uniref:Monovalent cation/H+ antiporter subunit E n=1 Tax=Lederbergia galactosidilytica TaxID=217031 RepID=A0A177ZJ29_9BACI|nr:Na+/H+ antiporter subunit E [Lederbergia galactosidilytica]KRG15219.1 monovalent cation/H+ antiporter subunit E [Virgibacillus soli]MBP1913117.1 multicomponent Na+:H+ antiporter subunit E [Lederbergia galactosidilytica]OAK67815.1 monovalent cation/H+ antiporter subunit E [Lederbergia galactosidilytica]
MAFQILLNFFMAFLWMFFESSFQLNTFLIGYLLGLLIIFIMRRFFPGRFYLAKVFAIIKLVLIFIRELLLSNIAVLKVVLSPKLSIRPGIFALQTELRSDWEITLLSHLITLTPGTLVVKLSEDNKTLYIHAIDIEEVDDAINSIKQSFEKAIMEVSR